MASFGYMLRVGRAHAPRGCPGGVRSPQGASRPTRAHMAPVASEPREGEPFFTGGSLSMGHSAWKNEPDGPWKRKAQSGTLSLTSGADAAAHGPGGTAPTSPQFWPTAAWALGLTLYFPELALGASRKVEGELDGATPRGGGRLLADRAVVDRHQLPGVVTFDHSGHHFVGVRTHSAPPPRGG